MSNFLLLFKITKKYLFTLILIFFILGLVPFVYIKYVIPAISNILLSIQKKFIFHTILKKCIFVFFGYGLLQLLHFVGLQILSTTLSKIHQDVKTYAFKLALRLPLMSIMTQNDGEIERSISVLSESICQSIEMFAFYIFHHLLSIIFLIHTIIATQKYVGIFVIIWVIVLFSSIVIFSKSVIQHNSNLVNIRNQQSGFITDIFKNIILTKILKIQNLHDKSFKILQNKDNQVYTKVNQSIANSKIVIATINVFFLCIYWFLLSKYSYTITNKTKIINLFQFGSKVVEALWQLLCNGLPCFYIFGKLSGVLPFLNKQQEDLSGFIVPMHVDNIKINNLSYQYNENRTLFNGLSFSGRKKFILIKGASGTGKSVLIKILIGLITPSKGTVFIDKHDITDIDKNLLLKRISFLPQNDMIFNNTIQYNIKIGNPDATNQEIQDVCKFAAVEDFVSLFNEKYEKQCGNNGNNLSGGQIKRISFARMLLYDKPGNLIVLDEPFNNLDSQTVGLILNYLKSLKGHRTILCVDHSEYFQDIADQTINIE